MASLASLFLDTAGWFAALAPPEKGHAIARRTYAEAARAGQLLVTTTFVVAEMHTLLLRWRDARAGRQFLDAVFESGVHMIAPVDGELVEAAIARWIRGYADQSFSLCDAISFEVMRRERIARALTFDNHFSVAGFATLR